ncbi:hybrid sensor histidine kinase/response regulator [Halocynthiibacter styelae]|uniref:histidine kinase n=1 Tax=Halocynthiibacter styelae TaxID=2761955 RepID=A0A8J7IEK8_9RHOB|nr:response regulator [Paenihalocynthiibacter styelae]MBI1493737.1 response regulator [Paenihalocynthiibacter styelae]
MNANNQTAREALNCFEIRNRPDGLFLRYARGYVAAVPVRLAMMTFAAVLLAVITTPGLALLAYLIGMTGEVVHISSLLKDRKIPIAEYQCSRRRRDIQRLTAAFQAICASIGLAIVWSASDLGETRFFAFVCITTLIIHASITMPFFPWGSRLRLGIYILVSIFLILHDIQIADGMDPGLGFDLAAISLFSLMAVMLMVSRYKSFHAAQLAKRHLLQEKLEAEEARDRLIRSQNLTKQLALVARNASDIVIITETDGTISWVNDTFIHSTGYSEKDILGKHVKMLNGPETDPAVIQKLIQARKEGEGVRTEILNYDKNGQTKWYEINISPVYDDMGILINFVSIERDIHALKQREADLAEARETAEETARAKTAFLATMSHEIRTPMNGIIGVTDLLLESDLNPDQRHLTETISDAGGALLGIINNTLDLTRLEAGKAELEQHNFSVRQVALKTTELLKPIANGKQIGLNIHIAEDVPDTITGDPGRFRQVLMNLIGNAIKFTSDGQVDCEIFGPEAPEVPEISVVIHDTGIGIAENKLSAIFEEFTQADSSVSRRFGGTGLGLSISQKLAHAMGGRISVTSTIGIGSAFTLTLPARLPSENEPLLTSQPGNSSLKGKSVLIADDNKTNRFILSRLLRDTGMDLDFATDGFEVIDSFHKNKPDLILMDVSMPGKDGLEATREIRKFEEQNRYLAVPIYALTANAFSSHQSDCTSAGMNGFLTKPVKKDVLVGTLTKIFSDSTGNPAIS